MRTTKKSLWLSALSLCLCAMILLGTTFAWFTDSVVNKDNTIQAGSLDVNFEYRNLKSTGDVEYVAVPDDPASTGALFTNTTIWEPGKSFGYDFRVTNDGSLAFDWELSFQNIKCEGGNGDVQLADVLDVYVLEDVNSEKMDDTALVDTLSKLPDGVATSGRLTTKGTTKTFSVVIKMKETANNDYQNAKVTFDVYLRAKQAPVETDGFDNSNYDAGAVYEQVTVDATNDEKANGKALQDALEEAKPGTTIFISEGTYDLPAGTETIEGQAGWLMPITQDGITIKGVGNVVIKSSDPSENGAHATQNVITVFADNVTLENLIIEPRASKNKNVEVQGENFTMKNCTVSVGSLYFSGDKGNVVVSGNTFEEDSCICFDSTSTAGSIRIEGNTFKDCTYYAVGNVTWTSPATLEMANVQVKGNTFENVANILRHRLASGVFEFDGTNTLNGQKLDAVLLAQYINSDPHSALTAEQLKNRLVATVEGKEIRVGTDFLVGQNRGWINNTTFDFGWAINKTNTKLDAEKGTTNTTTINALVASLKDKSTETVLQTKTAKLDQLLFGTDGACAYPESWEKGWMSNAFLTREASDGTYWNATAMTATEASNPNTIVTIVMEHRDGAVYFVRY